MEYFVFLIILLLILWIIYIAFFKLKNRKKLWEAKIKDFRKKLKQIQSSISSKEKLIDSDKLYHKILLELWYSGDFWEILKQKPIIIWDLDKIWELHKIRNKLVHDFDNYDEVFLKGKSKEFLSEVEKLLKDLK